MQFRYFGKRLLLEDISVRSKPTITLSGQVGYKIGEKVQVMLQVFNLLNSHDHAIDYYYTSRLLGESTEGIDDNHFHAIETPSI